MGVPRQGGRDGHYTRLGHRNLVLLLRLERDRPSEPRPPRSVRGEASGARRRMPSSFGRIRPNRRLGFPAAPRACSSGTAEASARPQSGACGSRTREQSDARFSHEDSLGIESGTAVANARTTSSRASIMFCFHHEHQRHGRDVRRAAREAERARRRARRRGRATCGLPGEPDSEERGDDTAGGERRARSADDPVRRARRRAAAEAGFAAHVTVYLSVIGLLAFINLMTGGGPWFLWPAFGWGIGHLLALHGRLRLAHGARALLRAGGRARGAAREGGACRPRSRRASTSCRRRSRTRSATRSPPPRAWCSRWARTRTRSRTSSTPRSRSTSSIASSAASRTS